MPSNRCTALTAILVTTFCFTGSALSQSIARSIELAVDFSGQPIPCYKGGVLLAYDSDHTTVRAFDKTGALATTARLSLPGAARVMVRDIAIAGTGELVAAATAQDGDGRLASVIAWMDRRGEVVRVVRTTPYSPRHISFSADGNLWAVGRVYDSQYKDVPGHEIVRLYDPQGRLLKSLLRRDSFAEPGPHPTRDSFLVRGSDRMGFYSANAAEWVEISLTGEVMGRWRGLAPPDGATLLGAGLTSSGILYLGGLKQPGAGEAADSANVLYQLDKARGVLMPVPDLMPVHGASQGILLLAADDRQLVFYRKSPRGLDWVNLP